MRRVNNKKMIRKIADKTRKAGKTRNLIAILAIALTTVLFTSVFTIGGSIIKKQQEATMRQVGGSAHAGYKYLTQAEYDIVKADKKLKEVSYRIAVGDVVNEELKKLYTEVSYYEDLDAKMSFCYPEKGHMPKKKDEIVTSDLVLKRLGISCRIGEKVPLVLKVGKKTIEKTFILSGWFHGDTISQAQLVAVSKAYANEVAPTPVTSAMGRNIDASDYSGRIMADFNFATSFHLEKQADELTKRCGFPESIDTGINWAYMGGKIDPETIVLIAGILLVILISGYLIIYNIFYIHVYQDIRYYGLLKTIGTTGKQLRKIVRRQAHMLSAFGIPIGLIIGAVIGKILLPVIMGNLIFGSSSTDTKIVLNIWVFAGAAAFAFLTVLLSCIKPCRMASRISPVEAVRYTEGQQAGSRKKQKMKKTKKVTPRAMAFQNICRNKKKMAIVVASLSLALVLLNSIYSLVQGFDVDKFVSSMVVSDYSVSDATLDNFSVDYNAIVTDGVTKEFQKALKEQKGIEEIGNIYLKEINPTFTDESYALVEKRIFENEDFQKYFQNTMGEDGPDIEEYRKDRFVDGKVYGIGKMVMEKLENIEGELDWKKFSSGNYVIASRWRMDDDKSIDYFQPGEKVRISNENGESKEYEVLAVAEMPYACGIQHFGIFECNYILPENEFLDLMGEQNPMRTVFNVDEKQEEKVGTWLSDYCETVNPDLTYTSKASIVQEFDSYKNMYTTVGGLLALILAMIGILNFINTIVTSVLSRKQEFAMMEAVGMTGKQLKEMLCFEGGYYAIFTIIIALILSAALSVTVVRPIGNSFFFFTWKFTVMPIMLCIPLIIAVVMIVPLVCYRNMKKVSVVERMQKME
ncbi:MAG: ABC transporter permease [Lachnospiraceae bacterium]|nr:ABC transporter permease [Lachnospiraceae bacterium]